MINRLENTSMLDHLGSAERRSEPPDAAREFAKIFRGIEQAADAPLTSPTGKGGIRSRDTAMPKVATDSTAGAASAPEDASVARLEVKTTKVATAAPAAEKSSAPTTPTAGPTAPPSAAGFVRTTDTKAPHLPRFKAVPESAKQPLGPYRQAPGSAGGDWWLVSPFTGPEPWRALDAASNPKNAAVDSQAAPDGFVRVFGPRPEGGAAATQWQQDLGYFKGTGLPEGFNEEQLDAAKAEFDAWGLGEPVFYEGRYGWQVRFPDSQLPMFETTASTALLTPHLVIAEHQVRSIQEGIVPGQYHPWLPERISA